ncbi:hypothetical protein HAX54_002116, partial [Datura stramonium]|nr:hypothetical protein [Datura stramonium]
AWYIISQAYNWRELLQEIFSQVAGSKDKGDKVDELADELLQEIFSQVAGSKDKGDKVDEFADKLRKKLNGERDISLSRIIVTTRLEKAGEHVKRHTDLYFLPFLPLDESGKLLQKKVFQKEDCPPELQDVSLAVAQKCKGLPLVIILVAGIIKRKKIEASWWHEVKDSLFDNLDRESEEYSW